MRLSMLTCGCWASFRGSSPSLWKEKSSWPPSSCRPFSPAWMKLLKCTVSLQTQPMSAIPAAIATSRDRTLGAVSRMLLSALVKQMHHLWIQITFMKTWRNCAWKTTSLSNPSAQRCSAEWVTLIFVLFICVFADVSQHSQTFLLLFINAASFIFQSVNLSDICKLFVLCPVCLSSRVQKGSGFRNWPPGSAATSPGPWTRLKTGRKKSHASTPSYWYHTDLHSDILTPA